MRSPFIRFDGTAMLTMLLVVTCAAIAAPPDGPLDAPKAHQPDFDTLREQYAAAVHPLVARYCLECHSAQKKKGELDMERFAALADVRRDAGVWRKVIDQLESNEMPPAKQPQPSEAQRKAVIDWATRYLRAEALANAGDPGDVSLRRLSNAEYAYMLADLTGVALDPARDLPIDGAAGEGFTNAGAALSMSPVLLNKYLQAAKRVADHAVLLPDGFRFSEDATRPDWTNEILAEIRALYAAHTSGPASAAALDKWAGADPSKLSMNDGRVDLTPYFAALIRHRETLKRDLASVEAIARDEQLNAVYLRHLATMLVTGEPRSALLDAVRRRWRTAKPGDADAIARDIAAWQNRLWRFNPVGHFGLIRPRQEAVDPFVESVTLRREADAEAQHDAVLYLAAGTAADGADGDVVVWRRPRIEVKGQSPILLRDVRPLARQLDRDVARELRNTTRYLAAVAEAHAKKTTLEKAATQHNLDAMLLQAWASYLNLGHTVDRRITGHFTNKLSNAHGYEAVNGWGVGATPNMLVNASDQPISFSTLTVPARGVTIHPSPTKPAAVAWRSPIAGRVTITGRVADADNVCGNGFAWSVELRSAGGKQTIASGDVGNGKEAAFKPERAFDVAKDDVISLIIAARDKDHVCDTTHVELSISEHGDPDKGRRLLRKWNVAGDVVDSIHAGNPHADSYKNEGVWHFYAISDGDDDKAQRETAPAGSTLARWRSAAAEGATGDELAALAKAVQRAIDDEASRGDTDRAMVQRLTAWDGPLNWLSRAEMSRRQNSGGDAPNVNATNDDESKDETSNDEASKDNAYGLDPSRFGQHLNGNEIDDASLVVQAPHVLEIRLPAALLRTGAFVVDGELDATAGENGSVQLQLLTEKPTNLAHLSPAAPILTRPDSPARQRIAAAYDEFRELFPVIMCYPRIVPVDEVVTLILYHREDEPLRRLMLTAHERARLDRLWAELRFVSEDAPRLVTVFEQLNEFATQDAQHLLPKFKALEAPIAARVAAHEQAKRDAEPRQLQQLLAFADRAWRRPLSNEEKDELTSLYRALRKQHQSHDEAFRAVLARLLVSPAFLYKIEQPAPGAEPQPVTDVELAARLSLFLWSSMPDASLRRLADENKLRRDGVLADEVRRMLKDDGVRRLATEFAAQWLGVRDFHEHNEKNEALYPSFAAVRGPMREEVVRFFADQFARDGSVLEILDADHTFLNAALAKHYGIKDFGGAASETESTWRRVEGMKQRGRGGILGMGAVVAKHSGASRTSPVLRGTWLVETLLGEHLPKPPPDVPDLPETEADSTLTVRQLTERHRAVQQCAVCHDRIDPYGFALESFDTIGRSRQKDDAGRPIDAKVTLKTGASFDGVAGLRHYLLTTRREQFVRQFCRKLLGFALGRGVEISDEPLLDTMVSELKANDYRVSAAVMTIVNSKQFRYKRGRDAAKDSQP